MTPELPADRPRGILGRRRPSLDLVYGELQPPTLRGLARVALLAGMILVGTVLALFRTPRSTWNLLWAEDGAVFVSGALSDGPGVIFGGYAGYLHLVPRVAAELAVLFPLSWVPAVVTISAAAITSLLACASFVFLETRIRSIPLRFAAWGVCLVLPTMGGDVANNLANLHWFLLIAAFCALFSRSRSLTFAVVQCAVVFGAATSDALALLLLPFALARLWLMPAWRDRSVGLAYLVGAALQLVAVVNGLLGTGPARQIAEEFPTLARLVDLYVHRSILAGLFGLQGAGSALETVGTVLPGLALAAVILVIVLAVRADANRRVAVIAFAASSAVFACIVYSLQWYAIESTPVTDIFVGLRYAVVPTALILLSLLQALDVVIGRVRRPVLRTSLGGLVLVAVLVPAAVDYRSTISREGPSWEAALNDGAALCAEGEAQDGSVVIPTPPVWFGGMLFPCSVLEQSGSRR